MSDVWPRRKPSLSASRMATSVTSGRSRPSRSRFTPDQHVVLTEAELPHDLDPLERVDLRVQVARLHARLEQVVGEVLRHLLRQRRHENALACLLAMADLVQKVVDLVLRRAQLDVGIDDPRRPDDLLGDLGRLAQLVGARRRRHEDQLRHELEELVEAQRPVVDRRRQPEAVLDERLLARAVTLVHAADLGDGLVRLVDEEQEVAREEVEQAVGRDAARRGRRGSASSSRCRCSTRAPASSPCRTRCAGGSGAPRAASPASSNSRTCSSSSAWISSSARSIDRPVRHVLRRREDGEVVEPA